MDSKDHPASGEKSTDGSRPRVAATAAARSDNLIVVCHSCGQKGHHHKQCRMSLCHTCGKLDHFHAKCAEQKPSKRFIGKVGSALGEFGMGRLLRHIVDNFPEVDEWVKTVTLPQIVNDTIGAKRRGRKNIPAAIPIAATGEGPSTSGSPNQAGQLDSNQSMSCKRPAVDVNPAPPAKVSKVNEEEEGDDICFGTEKDWEAAAAKTIAAGNSEPKGKEVTVAAEAKAKAKAAAEAEAQAKADAEAEAREQEELDREEWEWNQGLRGPKSYLEELVLKKQERDAHNKRVIEAEAKCKAERKKQLEDERARQGITSTVHPGTLIRSERTVGGRAYSGDIGASIEFCERWTCCGNIYGIGDRHCI